MTGEDDGVQAFQEGQQLGHQEEEEGQEEGASGARPALQEQEDSVSQEEVTSKIPQSLVFDLCQEARRHRPSEICGFLLRDGGTWRQAKMVNTAIGDLEFAMSPEDTIEVFEKWGRQILGVYHSHPEGTEVPSQTDVDYAPIGLRYWIVTPDVVTEWDMTSGTPKRVSIQARSA